MLRKTQSCVQILPLFTLRELCIIMNMTTQLLAKGLHQNDLELLQHAFDALHRTTGLEGRLVTTPVAGQDGRSADALVEIVAEGKRQRYVAALQWVDRFATLGLIKHRLERYNQPGLLVAPYITPEVAERCRELHLPFIDTVGNVYLRAPGLLVFVKGQRARRADLPRADTRPRTGTATALRVVFALLCRPELLNAPYREIVRAAGVALGAVSGVFRDLQGRGYITGGVQKGDRRLLEPQRLFEEWVTTYPLQLRPKLHPRRFRAARPDWWQRADVTIFGAQWGGEVAADKLTGYLKPETMTLYVRPEKERENVTQLVATHRLRADPTGEIELLDTFWDFPAEPDHPEVVPPLLVYADLVATHDPRNLDVARLVYDRKIAHALRPV
jgi:hypothetical protein